jgi:hypothetical protein
LRLSPPYREGATIADLERISNALNHLTGVVAGLVPAPSKLLAQTKTIEVAWTSPATTLDSGSINVGQATQLRATLALRTRAADGTQASGDGSLP